MPPADDLSPAERFAAHCRAGELAYQWDTAAAAAVFYPRLGPGLEWRVSAGAGTVYSVTWLHPRDDDAYNVALIDLDEGFRMMSRVEAETVEIGARVTVAFDADAVPYFVPA
jgi:hypothetical protein